MNIEEQGTPVDPARNQALMALTVGMWVTFVSEVLRNKDQFVTQRSRAAPKEEWDRLVALLDGYRIASKFPHRPAVLSIDCSILAETNAFEFGAQVEHGYSAFHLTSFNVHFREEIVQAYDKAWDDYVASLWSAGVITCAPTKISFEDFMQSARGLKLQLQPA